MLTVDEITKTVGNIASEYPIKKATLLGSYADGTANENSDVDILMEFYTTTVSLFLLSEIRYRVEEALNKSVDIIHGPIPVGSMLEINKEVSIYEA